MLGIFSPYLFISYSRKDALFTSQLVNALENSGFRVFVDTADIDPGDNFVSKLSNEVNKATAIIPVITENYANSRWAQAELYQALTTKKPAIPVLSGNGTLSDLDPPLQRLLRDTQYYEIEDESLSQKSIDHLLKLLLVARHRHRKVVQRKTLIGFVLLTIFLLAVWWGISNSNRIEMERTRNETVRQIRQTDYVLQSKRIEMLATAVAGDSVALGEVIFLSNDPAQNNIARLNALMLGSKLREGQSSYRWHIDGLDLMHVELENVDFVKTSFVNSRWSDVSFNDGVFASAHWGGENLFTLSNVEFNRTQILASEFDSVNAIGVRFINTKIVGSTIDTTNFSKVKFVTLSPETEGNPIISPYFSSIEKSVLISRREPPAEGVLDLTLTGDDVVFDDVLFLDCRLEGWFRPEWFRNSFFENCKFPASLSEQSLIEAGNVVQ